MTTAYAAGDGVIRVPEDFTDEIGAELLPLEQIWVMRRPILTIGPRFAPEITPGEIAGHFHDELKTLFDDKVLDPGSAYLAEVILALESSARTGKEPNVIAEPKPGIEAQVAQALHTALHGS